MAKKLVSMDALKNFVRREASQFLKQENITSVGIGYKIKDGKAIKQLSVQFTVAQKVAPELLESIGAVALPEFFLIDGVEVPTDILPRRFATHPKEVKLKAKLEAAASRKGVANPIVPGISIGHPSISAGTLGCVVYDAQAGTPYILSNWHILQGSAGRIGDNIVQPGKHDDNRAERNVIGHLVRSHLGVAGDCAIASIDQRRFDAKILDLNIAVERIGEPELGDKVVKSGRTTAVTYGIVNRIHVTTKINYEGAGVQEIGCFEIGPDPDHVAQEGQVSLGGDSGSAWLAVNRNEPTNMMVGLHFAGETGDEPDHALACYSASVFEKLGIQPTRPNEMVSVAELALGYAPNFIGQEIPLPISASKITQDDLLELSGRVVIDYTHFSLAMSRSRRFARWVAWNIDGSSLLKLSRNAMTFKKDPNVPANAQVGNELYANNALDKGHIARRADLIWGPLAEAQRANLDSFYYTNITPQHEAFNQSGAHGIWGELENAIFAEVDVEKLHLSVIGGPIFSDNDPVYRDIQLPKQFWKVIYFRETDDESIKAKGYVLTQADLLNQLEVLELPEFSVYELAIPQIAEMAGLVLPVPPNTDSRVRRSSIEAIENHDIRRVSSVLEIL